MVGLSSAQISRIPGESAHASHPDGIHPGAGSLSCDLGFSKHISGCDIFRIEGNTLEERTYPIYPSFFS